tara:strand:+ start:102 stop:461 length:360 start_codon:yes stop_codon:yes gene_type:complete
MVVPELAKVSVWLPTLKAETVFTSVKSRSTKSTHCAAPPVPAMRSVKPIDLERPLFVAVTRTCTASPAVPPLGAVQLGVAVAGPVTVTALPSDAFSTVVLSTALSGLLIDNERAPAETL